MSEEPAIPLAAGPVGTVYAAVTTDLHEIPPSVITRVYKSPDEGATWAQLLQVNNSAIRIVVDPQSPTTLYRISTLGPSDLHFPVFRGSLHRSTDGGTTWSSIDMGLDGNVISALAVDPSSPTTIYLSSVPVGRPISPLPPPGMFKTTDAGLTWTLLTGVPLDVAFLVIDPFVPTTVFAAGSGGVFRSTDAGNTFDLINATLNASVNLSGLVIDPIDPRRLYAATLGQGVFESGDGGATWAARSAGLAEASLYVTTLVIDSTGNYLHATTEAPGVFEFQIRQSRSQIEPPDRGLGRSRVVTPRPLAQPTVPK